MSSPVGPLDVTQFNNDLQNTGSSTGSSQFDVWYGDYQTFYPGATVQEFEAKMLPFANAVQEKYGDFDPADPAVYTRFLGALAATTAGTSSTTANPVNYGFRDSDTNPPTPTASQLLATWVTFYKQYNTDDTTSLSDIEQGIDLPFDKSLGSFIEGTQANGGLYWPGNETYEVYQGHVVLATFSLEEANAWKADYMTYYPAASEAEFLGIVGLYAGQQSSLVTPANKQAFRNYVQNNALSPPFATWQATYATYFPGTSSAAFQTFLNTFINGLPTQLTVANSSQFFLQFQGYVIADSFGEVEAQNWQAYYKQYYRADTSTDPLTDSAFLTFLGQFSQQSGLGVLNATSSLPQFCGALATSLLNSTQASLLQALYTQANPGASTANYLAYIGSLYPPLSTVEPPPPPEPPPTPDMLAGLVLYNILSGNGLLAAWQAAYQKYYSGSTTSQLQDFFGEYVLSQQTAINPQSGLFQFAGATALSSFPQAAVNQWQAYYLQYNPGGLTSLFQSLVGEADHHSSTPLDPVASFSLFQKAVIDGLLYPPLPTWQAVYADLGLPTNSFQSDLDAFIATQTVPLNMNTAYQAFISYLLTTYPSVPTIKQFEENWQKAYNQNFQQGSIPTPFAFDLARYLSFQYQVNAGGITDADVARGQQAFVVGGFTQTDIDSWQAVYEESNPGAVQSQFLYLVGLFASYQPNGQITPSLLPQFTTLVESGRYYGFIINPAAIELGKLATAAFTPAEFTTWQTFYNSYNPGANINQFYSFIAQQFAPNIPVGSMKSAGGQLNPITAEGEFQTWVANNAFVNWTNSMSQVDYRSYQVVYQELFPEHTAKQFQEFLLDYTAQFPVPTSPGNPNLFYDLFVGTALVDGGVWGSTSATYTPFKTFYDQYFPGATEEQFETFLGGFANQLLLVNQTAIHQGTVVASTMLANSLPQFEQAVVDAAFAAALANYSGVGDFIFPASGTASLVPSTYANWYSLYQQVIPGATAADFQDAFNHFITSRIQQGATINPVGALPLFVGEVLFFNSVSFDSGAGAAIKQALYTFLRTVGIPNPAGGGGVIAFSYLEPLDGSNVAQINNSMQISGDGVSFTISISNIQDLPWSAPPSTPFAMTFTYDENGLVSSVDLKDANPSSPNYDTVIFAAGSPITDPTLVNDFMAAIGLPAWRMAYEQNTVGATEEGYFETLGRFFLNHNIASNGSSALGLSAIAGFTSGELNTWWNYYKLYNLADTSASAQVDVRFLALVGQLASQLNVGVLNASADLTSFKNLVDSVSFTDWTNSMSKVDFTSWQGVYSRFFPGNTPAQFQAFLVDFLSTLPAPANPNDPLVSPTDSLQLYNQFVGALLLQNGTVGGSSATYTAFQTFYNQYYPGATAAQFEAYLGQFAGQLLLSNLPALANGSVTPTTLLSGSTAQFQQQVVDNAFAAALVGYTGVGSFAFPPSGTATLAPSAYARWYTLYQQLVPGTSIATFQGVFNSFITERVQAGAVINPTQSLSSFIARQLFGSSVTLSPAWETAYTQNTPASEATEDNYYEALGRFFLNHNISSNGSIQLGATATAGFSAGDLDAWWGYYKAYNLADTSATAQTDVHFMALVGQLAAQLNVTTLDASTDLAAFQNLIDSISFIDWTNSMSKVDFTSWQSIYSQFFPTYTQDYFHSYLVAFLSTLPTPVNPNDPLVSPTDALKLYNQFVGTLLLENGEVGGSSVTYGAFQYFYNEYYPEAITPQFQVYLGQFASQLLLSNINGISNGTINPATLLAGSAAQFRQQVVDNAFAAALSSYTGPSAFVFPPVGVPATVVPTSYGSWNAAYQQVNPGETIADFQAALNAFITAQVAGGAVIDPAWSLPTFVGTLFVDNMSLASWEELFKQNQLGIPAAQVLTFQQQNAFSNALGQFFLNHASAAPVGTGNPTVTTALIAAGNTAVGALNSTQLATWWGFYKQYNSGDMSSSATEDQPFVAFLGQFYSSLSSADQTVFATDPDAFYALYQSQVMSLDYQTTGSIILSGFSPSEVGDWWSLYKQYNLADKSTLALTDTSFQAFVGQLAAQLQTTTPISYGSLLIFEDQIAAVSYVDWTNYVLGVPSSSDLPTINLSANAANRRRQALILNELFKVLNSMIGTIQQAVTTVGARLTFYADYQQEVTQEISDMPIYTASGPAGNPLVYTGSDVNSQNIYAQYQSSANSIVQARQATLRSLRDSVGSLTQQLQTTITQLNDAATNQGSIGTSILQTLSSILTLIFR